MAYNLAKISMNALMGPAFDAGIALTRLDERISRSPVGAGFLERAQFTDACASLWIDGELVHLEDLVLHDATRDICTPTHELTIARDVLRTRRRIAAQAPDWALSTEGIRTLRQTSEIASTGAGETKAAGDAFRTAVAALLPYVSVLSDDWINLHDLTRHDHQLATAHPGAALDILWAACRPPCIGRSSDINPLLDAIVTANPALATDRRVHKLRLRAVNY